MKRALGRQETQFLAYAQMRELRAVRTGDLMRPLGLTREQERELFRRLARGKLIARVRPGLYLVPKRLPLGGSWSPDEILALKESHNDRRRKIRGLVDVANHAGITDGDFYDLGFMRCE